VKAVWLALVLAACGGDHPTLDDAGTTPDGGTAANLTSYVIDLVKNQTADTTAARPYSEFQTLPDPDQNNASAYSSLFP
jgi:hypothetical protein